MRDCLRSARWGGNGQCRCSSRVARGGRFLGLRTGWHRNAAAASAGRRPPVHLHQHCVRAPQFHASAHKRRCRETHRSVSGPGGRLCLPQVAVFEQELARCCEEKAIPYVSLRPAMVYGKYNYAPRESWFFDLISKGEPIILPPPPQALFSMVSVWDLAWICIACLDNGAVAGGAYAVCADELVSCDRLIEALETITSAKVRRAAPDGARAQCRRPATALPTRGASGVLGRATPTDPAAPLSVPRGGHVKNV